MNTLFIAIIIFFLIVIFLLRRDINNKHSLRVYESVSSKPVREKKRYIDEIDYFMEPIAQATRLENGAKTDKKKLYNTYNEAVRRYNRVTPKIKAHPKVPNIETVVGQRDRAYLELLTAHVNNEVEPDRIITPTTPAQAPIRLIQINTPTPVLKEKKREDRLKIEVKSSAQNVHDHNVNDKLANRYRDLKKSNLREPSNNLHKDMYDFINTHDSTAKITEGFKSYYNTISRFDNDKEEDIWYTVWRRIHSEENKDNIDSLKNSLKDAIKDCNDDNMLVCLTGRATRALDSLTLLDKNEEISKPVLTDDLERKEVYDKAHSILQRELEIKGEDYKKRYESGELDDTDEFDNHVKECIKREIESSKYLNDALAAI